MNAEPHIYGIVYQALCIPSGKSYVGQTIRPLEVRWKAHRYTLEGCRALKAAIRKYGAESFVLSVLDTATSQEDLNQKEAYWIDRLGTISPGGYNLLQYDSGRKAPSAETREKMRQAKLAVSNTEEFKQAMSAAGKANKGKKKSPEHVAAVSAALAEARIKNGGGFHRVLTKPRADKGAKRSPETCERIREGLRASWARRRAEQVTGS